MATLYTQHFIQFLDDDGNPLSGGKLYTYEPGTTTPKATYTTTAGTTPNANPVVMDSAGRATVFLSGTYKFRLEDSAGNLIDETDNITSFATSDSGVDTITTSFTEDVIVAGDSIIFSDASDSGATKRDTVQGILDLTLQPGDATKQVGGTVVTTTSGTTANTGSLPAGIKSIHIGIAGVSTNGTSGIELALGTSGGIKTSGYLGSVVKNITGVATSLHPSDAFNLVETVWAAAGVLQGVVTLVLVDAATNTWAVGGTLSRSDTAITFTLSGSVALSGAITQLQLQTTNGTDTFDAGKFNIVYE